MGCGRGGARGRRREGDRLTRRTSLTSVPSGTCTMTSFPLRPFFPLRDAFKPEPPLNTNWLKSSASREAVARITTLPPRPPIPPIGRPNRVDESASADEDPDRARDRQTCRHEVSGVGAGRAGPVLERGGKARLDRDRNAPSKLTTPLPPWPPSTCTRMRSTNLRREGPDEKRRAWERCRSIVGKWSGLRRGNGVERS